MVKFCDECKSIMYPSKEDHTIVVCRKCGYKADTRGRDEVIKTPGRENELKIIEDDLETLPVTAVVCPSCAHREAKYYMRQTRAADEPTTLFYICTKCDNRWRTY